MLLVELKPIVIRVRNAVLRPSGSLQRLCRVRVMFPDIGFYPVLEDVACERLVDTEEFRGFPSPDQVLKHLTGLTTVQP